MILIIGAGAVGTTLATCLAAAGRELALYAREKDLVRLQPILQMRVDPPSGRGQALRAPRPPLRTRLDLDDVTQLLICVKSPDLDALIEQLPEHIPASCTLVCTLNGVAPLRRLRERWPGATIVPMSVMFNCQWLGPLHARLSTRAEIVLGTRDTRVLAAYAGGALTVKSVDGDRAVWGKLLINLANAICALTHSTFKDLFLDVALRRVYVAVLDEATAAMAAAGIPWKLPLIVPYRVYRSLLLRGGPLPWWFAKYRNGVGEGAYPSMVADFAAGRTTEVLQINGEIQRLAAAAHLAAPINARLVEMINAGRGAAPMTPGALRQALGV